MSFKKNISREDIANSIHTEFGFSKKECLHFVHDIIELIIDGLTKSGIVKIHNFGTFKLKRKKSRIGRNPKTKEEAVIDARRVVVFRASKELKNKVINE